MAPAGFARQARGLRLAWKLLKPERFTSDRNQFWFSVTPYTGSRY
ncbi:hypothetical protein BamMEX5DRAFT_0375 [Burkholderia ambifaria MEX-5]|uniref:Uncharacterized protein n=1 Tax=Burkholderia ambifaria MEX-5 TaxID=396597 RepID=B1SXV9_9BURK|nr:hypothetical protein BamMEX5DRAFT_0375 [Burkholderia ambifaria MEX-5]